MTIITGVDNGDKKKSSNIWCIGPIGLMIWVFVVMFLDDFGYEVTPEYYLVILIPLGLSIAGIFFNMQTNDLVGKHMKRGIIILFIGAIGIALWLYVLMSLRNVGQELLREHFLGFLPPLVIAFIGFGYVVYATYHMTKVRREIGSSELD